MNRVNAHYFQVGPRFFGIQLRQFLFFLLRKMGLLHSLWDTRILVPGLLYSVRMLHPMPRKELTPHVWDNRNANLYEGLYDLVFRKWSNHRLNIKGIKSCLCEDRPARTPHAISTLTIGCLGFMLCSFQSVKSFDNFENALHITAARRQMCFLIKAIDNKGNRLPIYPSPKTRFYPR